MSSSLEDDCSAGGGSCAGAAVFVLVGLVVRFLGTVSSSDSFAGVDPTAAAVWSRASSKVLLRFLGGLRAMDPLAQIGVNLLCGGLWWAIVSAYCQMLNLVIALAP